MLATVAHGAYLNLGRSGGDTYHHSQRWREPVVLFAYFLNHAANHLLGGVEVGNNAVAQRAYGGNALVHLAVHLAGGLAYGDGLHRLGVEGYHTRLINHNLVVVDDDGVGSSQVDCNFLSE